MSGQVVSVSGVKTASGISGLTNATATGSKSEIVKIGAPTIIQNQSASSATPKIVQSAQLQPITAQHLMNAKVLGVQGFQGVSQVSPLNQRVKAGTSIRMVNASNLNIANLDGKPIIIAKTPTMIQSAGQGNKTIWTQQGGGKANIIGTLPGQSSQVVFGNQIVKLQSPPQSAVQTSTPTMSVININANSANNTVTTASPSAGNVTTGTPKTVLLSSTGQAIKVHAPNVITSAAAAAGLKPTVKVILHL